jgi:hypothetical protein
MQGNDSIGGKGVPEGLHHRMRGEDHPVTPLPLKSSVTEAIQVTLAGRTRNLVSTRS